MSEPEHVISSLTEQLRRRYAQALISTWRPTHDGLRRFLSETLSAEPGESGALLAEPVFESLFGWQTAAETMGDLSGTLLHPSLVDALDRAETARFPREFHPYTHQLAAWQSLQGTPQRSAIISSGTGSGKTEAFMVPVLNDLASELSAGPSLRGVRALFLYPLNALIANQRERLAGWLSPFGGRARFCLYNGNTPESVPESEQRGAPAEVLSRKLLRAEPPPVLVTNPTMLEFMLVRQLDRPIIDASRGKLRWVILDEAHTYVGSNAAEISLLLRRVLHAFGATPGEVRFVATSATIGEGAESGPALQRFLADIAGLSVEQVVVITGERSVPDLEVDANDTSSLPSSPVELEALSPEQRFERLSRVREVRRLRERVACAPIALSDVVEELEMGSGTTRDDAIALLDACRTAVDSQGNSLLPLRTHFFVRTQPGLWACCNASCPGKEDGPLAGASWPFGQVFLTRRTSCIHCESLVLEMAWCDSCGAEYLRADERVADDGTSRLVPTERESLVLDDADLDEDADDETSTGDNPPAELTRLIDPHDPDLTLRQIDLHTGELDAPSAARLPIQVPGTRGARLTCTRCGTSDRARSSTFRPYRNGAPSALAVTTPILLAHAAPRGVERPFQGRQAITFTDSRRGTANFALRGQQDAERNAVRSFVYHRVWTNARTGAPDPKRVETARAELEALRASSVEVLRRMIPAKERELDELEAPGTGAQAWSKLAADLGRSHFTSWMASQWRASSQYSPESERDRGRMLLLREFARRPRRQNSLETLGLVRLSYPPLARVVDVPPDWTRRRLSIEQWRTFLKLVVDFFVRSVPAVRVPEEMLPWMGWNFRPKEIISPDADAPKGTLAYKVVRWPQCRALRLPRVAELLMRALELDPEDAQSRAEVDEYLRRAWIDLRQVKLLSLGGDGYSLDLDAGSFDDPAVQVEAIRRCSICPVTRRALDTVLLDTSPYLTRDFAKTKPQHVEMPEFVVARDNELAAVEAAPQTRQWLAEDRTVNAARELGVWTEYSDRIAEWSPYYRIAEHSAQLSQSVLRRFEDAFKSGAINILSCSTTMEMGVDIGGLNAVAMNNAPPGPANYRQRAGRAGRRGESIAMALTLCQASPHGEFVFRNPKWPFETPTHVPKVTLDSAPIVQRHVNAFLLTRFLRSCAENSLQLECGWFFGPVDELSTPWAAFMESLERDPCDEETQDGLRRIVAQSALEPRTADELGQAAAASLREIAVMWREQQAALDGLLRRADPESPAALAISRQLERFQGEYLLMYLGSAAFLPGHGFPSGIVPFVHTTRHEADLERRRRERKERYARERRPYASRSLPSALRDYAPGRSVTMNGRIYRSQGVTLNWKLPASDTQVSEIQALRQAWRCSSCGAAGLGLTRYANCPACNEPLSRVQETLVPAGFTTEFTEGPHANQEHEPPMPILRPWVSARGEEWAPLPDPAAGRQRATNSGLVIHRSAGEHGHGYALCLHCGFADSETSADGDSPELPSRIARHRPLRGGNHRKSEDGLCTGLQSSYAIRRRLMLGGEERTDVFELQLRTGSGRPMNEAQAFSIGVALRDSLCESLGIEGNEVGVSASRSEYDSGDHGYSALLYDTASGGAGYVAQVSELLANLLGAARARLGCPNECDSSCHGCLLGYDTQHDVDRLDRHAALDVLTAEFLDRLSVPDSLRLFGEETRVPTKAVPAAIGAALCEPWVEELDIFLPQPDSNWVWWDWPLSALVARLAHQPGAPDVELVLPDDSLAALPDEFRVPLAGILESSEQANVRVCFAGASESTVGHGLRLATVRGNGRSISWAVNVSALLTPGPGWAMASGEAGVVFARDESKDRASGRQVIDAARIRPQTASSVHRIVVRDELDGPVHQVGERLRNLISTTVPDLGELLETGLEAITYSDRYLVSPLSAAVALHMLSGLCAAQTRVELRTAAITNPRSGRGWRMDHDWREPRDHKAVLQAATLQMLGPHATLLVVNHTSGLPHARKMVLAAEGRTWTLHFDQGVGFLRHTAAQEFDFNASCNAQADAIRGLSLDVRNQPGVAQDVYVLRTS